MPKLGAMPARTADLIGAATAADILNVGRRTVTRYVAEGKLTPAAKVEARTGAYLFARRDVERLARQRAERGAA